MSNSQRWVVGGFMALFSFVGLFLAARTANATLYWTGLSFALVGVITIFNLIRIAYDEAEGKAARHYHIVPLALVAVALGSVLFHVVSPWWWTPIASNWGYIDDTITITFWITGIVFVAILLFTAYCVFRFYHQKGGKVAYEPENKKLEGWLTGVTAVGVAAMLAPGLFVWNDFVTVPKEATEIEVVAQQWSWSYRLPGTDGRLGTSSVRHIASDNPLGVNPNDPHGQDDVVIPGGDLHLPVGKPVKVLLRSVDVLHDFYVPEFRAKMDMVPGMITYFWFTPTRSGTFEIFCAELCGVGHYSMRGKVVIDEEKDYRAWRGKQKTFAQFSAETKQVAGGPQDPTLSQGARAAAMGGTGR